MDPNLTAARLLKSPKSCQNRRKTYVFDNVAFFAARALRWPQDGPGESKGGPRRPKTGPREGPGRAQDGSKTAPSRLQDASEGGQSATRDLVENEPGNAKKSSLSLYRNRGIYIYIMYILKGPIDGITKQHCFQPVDGIR